MVQSFAACPSNISYFNGNFIHWNSGNWRPNVPHERFECFVVESLCWPLLSTNENIKKDIFSCEISYLPSVHTPSCFGMISQHSPDFTVLWPCEITCTIEGSWSFFIENIKKGTVGSQFFFRTFTVVIEVTKYFCYMGLTSLRIRNDPADETEGFVLGWIRFGCTEFWVPLITFWDGLCKGQIIGYFDLTMLCRLLWDRA